MTQNIRDLLTPEELARVTGKDDLQAWSIVTFDWAVIVGLFVVTAAYPNPLTILLTIILLGGRQMALGVLVHETGHKSFFTSPAVNQFVGTWLSGYWVFSDKEAYMKGHLMHHKDCGTDVDPDLKNYDAYPVNRESLWRKFRRDLTGQIGWRRVKSIWRGFRHLSELKPHARETLTRGLACNLAMLAVMTLAGYPWLFVLWATAFMTTHMMITRIRQVAEHAAVPDNFDLDTRRNTRTIYINRLESLLIAPHDLNYHMEHHLNASIPIYRLRELHEILLEKGYYDGVEFPRGYFNLLRQVTYETNVQAA